MSIAKQLIVLLFVAGVVLCDDVEQQQQQAANEEPSTLSTTRRPSLRNSLLDLAIIGSKNAKRTFDDSRPTLNSIRSGLSKKFDDLRNNPAIKSRVDSLANNPQVKKGLEVAKQQVEGLYNQIATNPQVKPVLEQGKSKLSELMSQVDQRGRKILAEHEARQQELKNNQQ